MPEKDARDKASLQAARQGTLLGAEGRELAKGLWEEAVYLGTDGFVYHVETSQTRGGIEKKIVGKRDIGEYLRWVDGLFRPGEIPSESSGIHFRAARKLRELL